MSPNPVVVRRETASHLLTSAFSQGGSTILVDGYSGMGKTYFLRELADQARQHGGWTVTFVSADRIERGEPYSFIERFLDRKSTRLNSSHVAISYAVFCLKK